MPVMAKEMSEEERGRGEALEQGGLGTWGASGIGCGHGQHSDGVWGSAPQGWRVGRLQEGQQVTVGDTALRQDVPHAVTAEQLTFPILYRGREGPGGRSFTELCG